MDGSGIPGTAVHDKEWVSFGGITLGEVDQFGVRWILGDLSGWDTVASTGETQARTNDHGAWLTPAFYGPRLIEIQGSFLSNDAETRSRTMDRLAAAIPLSKPAPFVVDEGWRSLQALVRQEGDPLIKKGANPGNATFSLSFVADDPRRYGSDLVVASTGLPIISGGLSLPLVLPISIGATVEAGQFEVQNAGNIDTPAVFTTSGPCPPGATVTLRSTGARLRFAEAIPAGRQLVIDTGAQTAFLDGVAPRTVTGTWFKYPPGTSQVRFTADGYDAGALLTSTHRSAWR